MIFLIISLILLAALIYLTVAASLKPKHLKLFRAIDTIVGAAGSAIALGSYIIAVFIINNASADAVWIEWAHDMFVGFFNLALPVLLVLFGIIMISALTSMAAKRPRCGFGVKVRVITPIAVSALLLIITYFYAPVTANATVPLDIFIYVAGIGMALTMRLAYTLEYTVQISSNKAKK